MRRWRRVEKVLPTLGQVRILASECLPGEDCSQFALRSPPRQSRVNRPAPASSLARLLQRPPPAGRYFFDAVERRRTRSFVHAPIGPLPYGRGSERGLPNRDRQGAVYAPTLAVCELLLRAQSPGFLPAQPSAIPGLDRP